LHSAAAASSPPIWQMHELRGLRPHEIAKYLGLSPAEVCSRPRYARTMLRVLLRRESGRGVCEYGGEMPIERLMLGTSILLLASVIASTASGRLDVRRCWCFWFWGCSPARMDGAVSTSITLTPKRRTVTEPRIDPGAVHERRSGHRGVFGGRRIAREGKARRRSQRAT
jgi:hypothetical protein